MRLALAAGDAGSASVLMPVAEELQRRGCALGIHVAGPAARLWRAVPASGHAEPVSPQAADAIVEGAQLLVTGAGAYTTIEHEARLAARRRGIVTLAVMDFWGRIDERFARARGGASRPDLVCALEPRNRVELLEAGFRAEQVVVTGSPHLEGVAAFFRGLRADEPPRWRARLGVGEQELLVLFVSEPFEPHERDEAGRSLMGYDDLSTLQALLRSCQAAAASVRRRVLVAVRPHPRQDAGPLAAVVAAWQGDGVRAAMAEEDDARCWVAGSDVVAGMASVVLLEAALAGKTALSIQIGRLATGRADPNPANQLGLTLGIHAETALVEELRAALGGHGFAPDPRALETLAGPGCAARVADLALEAGARGAQS